MRPPSGPWSPSQLPQPSPYPLWTSHLTSSSLPNHSFPSQDWLLELTGKTKEAGMSKKITERRCQDSINDRCV